MNGEKWKRLFYTLKGIKSRDWDCKLLFLRLLAREPAAAGEISIVSTIIDFSTRYARSK